MTTTTIDTVKNSSISESTIQNRALEGRYYNLNTKNWDSLGLSEWLFRSILSCLGLVSSVKQSCTRYSWQSVEQMVELPKNIADNIERYFVESRSQNHILNAAAPSITAIYCKSLPPSLDRFTIEEDDKCRLFKIFKNNVIESTVVNRVYGELDFYDKKDTKVFINTHDKLYEAPSNKLIGSVTVKSDSVPPLRKLFGKECTQIDILPESILKATVAAEGDPTSFVFRDSTTQKILAIAIWTRKPGIPAKEGSIQKWSLTLMPDAKHMDIHFFTWALLKHSQKYLRSADVSPYVEKYPPR